MKGNGKKKRIVDWESIEEEYRLGINTIRSIAERYNVGPSGICDYAKRHGWERDLTKKVQRSTETKLTGLQLNKLNNGLNKLNNGLNNQKDNDLVDKVSNEFSDDFCEEQQALINKEESLVDRASDVAVGIVLKHRQKIDNCQKLFDKAEEFLKKEVVSSDNYYTWTRAMNTGIDALGKAIKLERQAYNMEDNANTEEVTGILDLIENETMAVTREDQAKGANVEGEGEGKT